MVRTDRHLSHEHALILHQFLSQQLYLIFLHTGFVQVQGYERLVYEFHGGVPPSLLTSNSSCGMPSEEAFHIFRDPLSEDLPWPGALTGAILKSCWYWCADQVGALCIMGM